LVSPLLSLPPCPVCSPRLLVLLDFMSVNPSSSIPSSKWNRIVTYVV
jgi:hypothetical protein